MKVTKSKNVSNQPADSDSDAESNEHENENQTDDQVPRKLFVTAENAEHKLVGVIVTIFEGSSYDKMFREVQPTTVPGERVSTYSIRCRDVKWLHDYLTAAMPVPEAWISLVGDLACVEADSVVFNWECCGSCGDQPFPCSTDRVASGRFLSSHQRRRQSQAAPVESETMRFMALVLQRGFTIMCSDFSLKSLIHEWSEEHLGPNPFLKVGSCASQFQLEFVPADLQHEEVPQQLQVVGQLCNDNGKATVSAMDNTIVYTINPKRPVTRVYDLKVLTVATAFDGHELADDMMCSIGEGEGLKRGAAGHVALTYASGGQLVTSMGHWIELTRINTSLESVLRCAQHEFGGAEVEDLRLEYNGLSTESDRYECLQKRSKQMIQKSVPSRMKCKTKY